MTIADALEQAGREFMEQGVIPVAKLRKRAAQIGGYREGSVIPSDFCYNRTNAGIRFMAKPMFVYEGRGLYRFVGVHYAYTGLVYHKAQGGPEIIEGEWVNGKLGPAR